MAQFLLTTTTTTRTYDGGYPESFIVKEKCDLLEHFLCPLCKRVSRDPISSGCSNMDFACESCMKQYMEMQKGEMECPKCHELIEDKNFNSFYLRPAAQTRKLIQDFLWIRCEYCEKEEMKLKDYIKHYETICPFRKSICKLCHQKDISENDMEKHLKILCECREVECPFFKSGCQVFVMAKDLTTHLKESEAIHLSLLISKMVSLEQLQQNHQQQITELIQDKQQLIQNNQELKQFNQNLEQKNQQMEEKINQLDRRFDELKQTNQQLEKHVGELNQTNQNLTSNLSNLTMFRLPHNKIFGHWDDRVVVFESKYNPKDQNLYLVNCTQNLFIPWFNSQYFENNKNLLMREAWSRDMLWIKEVKKEKLQKLGFFNDNFQYLTNNLFFSMLIKVSENKDENIGMVLNGNNIVSFQLPSFNQINYPNQLLFHQNVGLICMDNDCFTQCEQLLISEPEEKEKEKENKNERINEEKLNWIKLPSFQNKKVDLLSGAVLCERKKGWNEFNSYELFTHSANKKMTAILKLNEGNKWMDLPDNQFNRHGSLSSVYDWKERNHGNIIVINGHTNFSLSKYVSEFDSEKQEWLKLPDTNYCHTQDNRANVYVNKENGLLTVMSYHAVDKNTGQERKKKQTAIIEVLDIREKQSWKVLNMESQWLSQILPFNSQMNDNKTVCRILS